MSEHRLPDYLDHIRQAAADARGFVEGLDKEDFLEDKRTQQAVIMSLIIIGEAVTKVMNSCRIPELLSQLPAVRQDAVDDEGRNDCGIEI